MYQGEFDFGESVVTGYFERKEGIIFSLIREECAVDRITYRTRKKGHRKEFKVVTEEGSTFQLIFTDDFLFSRNAQEIKESIAFNLDYMKRVKIDSRAIFGRGLVKIRDL